MNRSKEPKENKPKKPNWAYTILVVLLMVVSTLTVVVAVSSPSGQKLIAIGTANTLYPNDVNNSLNITFSDLNYVTQPPQFQVIQGNYNISHSSYSKGTGGYFTNSTYQILNSTAASAVDLLQYNVSKDKGTPSYYFTESRIAFNGTGTENYAVSVLSPGTTALTAGSNTTAYVNIASGTPKLYYAASTGPTSISFTSENGFSGTMTSLQFYLVSIYLTNKTLTAGIYDTGNGTLLAKASVTPGSSTFYKYANMTSFQYVSPASLNTQAAYVVDWMYVATHNTYSTASPNVQSDAISQPFVGSASYVNTGTANMMAPFDPAGVQNASYAQSPNATQVHVNTNIGAKDFSSVSVANNTTTTHAVQLNTSDALANFNSGNQSMNSTQGFETLATLPENNGVVNANIHIAEWNASGINQAIDSFLKNYSAVQATVNTGIQTNYTSITILGYAVGSISIVTNLTSNAVPARNAIDNEIAALLSVHNLSLVDKNTSAIIAGAFAGDFWYEGMAIVPVIQGQMIENPITGQQFTLTSAGFASGAFISDGAVVVPQAKIIGYSFGTPIFSASGFSFGSLFGSLSSSGASVEQYLGSGASAIGNALGTAKTTAQNDIIKPITSTASNSITQAKSDLTGFSTDVSNLSNQIMPALGAIPADIKGDVSSGLGPIAGSLNNIKDSIGSISQSMTTAVGAGFSGLKTSVLTLGNDTTGALANIKSTLGTAVAQDKAVLSNMFTSISNLPGEISGKLTSIAAGVKNASKQDFNYLMNSAATYYTHVSGMLKNGTQSVFGSIGSKIWGGLTYIGGHISSGASSAWSMVTSFGAKVGYILEIVGLTVVGIVIVGLVLYFWMNSKPKISVPGEKSI